MDGKYARFAGLGFTFMVMIGLFTAGGYFLDRFVGTSPLFVMLGLLFGFVAAMAFLYVRLKEMGGG